MSEKIETMPKGYELIRYGLFCWKWIDSYGYVTLFGYFTAYGAMKAAHRHSEQMKKFTI